MWPFAELSRLDCVWLCSKDLMTVLCFLHFFGFLVEILFVSSLAQAIKVLGKHT